ncbi:MAG TPA: Hsp20/alpha crystallin family protein [Malonomonas sp.]
MNDKQMNNQPIESTASVRPATRLTPQVDIYENSNELVLLADLPGAVEQGLSVEVDRGILTLEAQLAVGQNREGNSYYRQFKLPERFDFSAGEALLKDGVLTLKLPKVAEAKPKKITVKTLH